MAHSDSAKCFVFNSAFCIIHLVWWHETRFRFLFFLVYILLLVAVIGCSVSEISWLCVQWPQWQFCRMYLLLHGSFLHLIRAYLKHNFFFLKLCFLKLNFMYSSYWNGISRRRSDVTRASNIGRPSIDRGEDSVFRMGGYEGESLSPQKNSENFMLKSVDFGAFWHGEMYM